MTILFVRTTNTISGAERYNYLLGESLQKYTAVRPIFLTDHEPFAAALKKRKFPTYALPIAVKEVGTKRDLAALFPKFTQILSTYVSTIAQIHQKEKIDVICFESMTEKLLLTGVLRKKGYKVVWLEHGPIFATSRSIIIKTMYRLASKQVHKIITVSEDSKKDLIAGGVMASKIVTIYIGIEPGSAPPSAMPNVVGFVGTLNEEKGVVDFLALAQMLAKKDTSLKFVIVGGGPKLSEVQAYVKNYNLSSRISVIGPVENVDEQLKQMGVVVFPTHHLEGLSLAIAEALAAGKIVFARNIGGNRELVIDGKTGYLFDHTDEALATKILDCFFHRERIGKMPYNALGHLKAYFDPRTQAKSFEKLFGSL